MALVMGLSADKVKSVILNNKDGPPSAVGNDALPPQSTTLHSSTDIPLHQ